MQTRVLQSGHRPFVTRAWPRHRQCCSPDGGTSSSQRRQGCSPDGVKAVLQTAGILPEALLQRTLSTRGRGGVRCWKRRRTSSAGSHHETKTTKRARQSLPGGASRDVTCNAIRNISVVHSEGSSSLAFCTNLAKPQSGCKKYM